MKTRIIFSLLLVSVILSPHFSLAQKSISLTGIVLDSATQLPLSYVNILIKGSNEGTSTLDVGQFSLTCEEGDTLMFSRIGYESITYLPNLTQPYLIINMKEYSHWLKDVTIYDRFIIPGLGRGEKNVQPFKMFTFGMQPVPTPSIVQTLGLSVTARGVLSYFSKPESEKRKLRKVIQDLNDTRVFREVISDPETKNYLMKSFHIDEQQYHKKLELLNLSDPTITYLKTKQEVIDMLVGFFALKD
jgi:hypothetical protein